MMCGNSGNLMKVSQLTESNVLSVWLGRIADFDDVDAYIWEHFERDFGIEFEEKTVPEADAKVEATPVRDLLAGFSFSRQWIENAVALCEKSGWTSANCAIVLFNVRYQPGLSKAGTACPVHFVANVDWAAE